MSAKKVVTGIVTAAVICGLGAGGWFLYKHFGGAVSGSTDKVYVQKVSIVNTVHGSSLYAKEFAGVIVAQKTVDVKYDAEKTIDEVLVSEGDQVKKGQHLLNYNVEAIQLQIDEAQLEVDRLENGIKTNQTEIDRLEQEKRTATGDAAVTYTANILSLQSENARSEYDIKTKKIELEKLEKSKNNAFITSPIDGTVKSLRDLNNPSDSFADKPDVFAVISAEGNYRVKGVFNETNSKQIHPGTQVFLKSRVDDTVTHGEISEIDTTPQDNNNYYDMYGSGMSDEQTGSSKYAFYVAPENLDDFMLGQHILIEIDDGQEEAEPKDGVWIYSSFVLWDGNANYVWAKTSYNTIEKRKVEVGTVDEKNGDCQILSGLSDDDYIAYPADYIESGMMTTTNQSDKDIPENVFSPDDSMFSDEDGGEFADDGMNYEIDDDGNTVVKDEEGNVLFRMDADGNIIEDNASGENNETESSGDSSDAESDDSSESEDSEAKKEE